MSILAWIEDQKRLKLLNAPKYVNPASDSSKGLWTRCDKCGVILYIKHLKENQRVCFGCSYHLQMSSQERVENLLDKNTWRPLDETVSPCDPLEFHDQKDYTDRLQEAQERTGLQDAIQTGSGMVDGIPIALGVMDFEFMGGSMGSVVGEKITRLIEYATQEGLVLVLVCASGGARMQEGVFSLMQMAKISSALQVYQKCAHLLYISILTSPTTGGVTASFAMLGDIIFAEPKALIAFAGRRVIEQTLCEDLPEDFQTSEYMLHHGLLDLIVPRRFLRQALSESIRMYRNAPFQKAGRIPFGVQNPITFLVEEKMRRRWGVGKDLVENRSTWGESPEFAQTQDKEQRELSMLQTDQRTFNYQTTFQEENRADDIKKADTIKRLDNSHSTKQENEDTSHSLTTKDFLAESAPSDKISPFNPSSENKKKDFGDVNSLQKTNRRNSVILYKDSTSSLLRRETGEYREILTSFQTMFYLFSKQFAIPYSFHKNKKQEKLQKENKAVQESNTYRNNRSIAGQFTTDSQEKNILSKFKSFDSKEKQSAHVLLHDFMQLSEQNNANKKQNQEHISALDSHDKSNGIERSDLRTIKDVEEADLIQTEKSKHLDTELPAAHTDVIFSTKNEKEALASPSAYIDFFNQSIELAATESVEWRAFYVHQSISQKTGFLEDFIQSFPEYSEKNHQIGSQNMLLYRSICRDVMSNSKQVT